ncbi:hypothetical protein HYALB_00006099 [Hymenoscyphus albidus]|uniref:Uncharacterized protein n=1 Tax=Hymenoscyphus albidus TaxID=595503 RepID=A0A9N9QD29_9HELO|nr:hypothetical protein HYALB_00006099 [Hymenoscyphus albidus]
MDLTTSLKLSRLESLPAELLHKIISPLEPCLTHGTSQITQHVIPTEQLHGTTSLEAQHNLISCLAISQSLHLATVPILYQRVELSSYSSLLKFHRQILRYPALGIYVKSLDLSNLILRSRTSYADVDSEAYRTWLAEVRAASDMIKKWLDLMPRLRDLKTPLEWSHEAYSGIEPQLDIHILQRLPRGQFPSLTTLEWGPTITPEFMCYLGRCRKGVETQVRRMVVRSTDIEITTAVRLLLETMPRVQDLDFTTSNVDLAEALSGLCGGSKLRSLVTTLKDSHAIPSISKFMASNPEIFDQLETLHLLYKASHTETPQPDTTEDISTIISLLPPTLLSLNLTGIPLSPSHLSLLVHHCPFLEELTLDTGIHLEDLETILLPPHTITGESTFRPPSPLQGPQEEEIESKYNTVLEPMAKAIAICKLRRRINSFSLAPHPPTIGYLSRVRYLCIEAMSRYEQKKLFTLLLLSEFSGCLERIVVGEWAVADGLFGGVCESVGWRYRRRGRICWVERVSL